MGKITVEIDENEAYEVLNNGPHGFMPDNVYNAIDDALPVRTHRVVVTFDLFGLTFQGPILVGARKAPTLEQIMDHLGHIRDALEVSEIRVEGSVEYEADIWVDA